MSANISRKITIALFDHEMSGGEQQRGAIARAIVNDPLILFADEPTGNLDTKSEEEIIKILEELNRQGKTIIMVTHEKEIAEHAKRIIFMRDGKIISDERKERSFSPKISSEEEKQKIEKILHAIHGSSAELIDHLRQAMQAILAHRKRLTDETKENIDIRNMAEIQATLASTTKTMSWLLGSIAIISLLVGGIGIMNIMLVSVTERTKEIGLRKAIGARAKDIMVQFLIESVVMTFSGGLIGIVLGIGVAVTLSVVAGWVIKVSISAVVFATLFSVGVGIIFGLWPARQASRLNPIEALRYE